MNANVNIQDDQMPLAEIALNAAIELDQAEGVGKETVWMRRLADALAKTGIVDFGLMPVYNRALTSVDGTGPSSKSDFYAKLHELGLRLGGEQDINPHDRSSLKDFCLALHDGLLNEGFQSHYNVVDNARLQ